MAESERPRDLGPLRHAGKTCRGADPRHARRTRTGCGDRRDPGGRRRRVAANQIGGRLRKPLSLSAALFVTDSVVRRLMSLATTRTSIEFGACCTAGAIDFAAFS